MYEQPEVRIREETQSIRGTLRTHGKGPLYSDMPNVDEDSEESLSEELFRDFECWSDDAAGGNQHEYLSEADAQHSDMRLSLNSRKVSVAVSPLSRRSFKPSQMSKSTTARTNEKLKKAD